MQMQYWTIVRRQIHCRYSESVINFAKQLCFRSSLSKPSSFIWNKIHEHERGVCTDKHMEGISKYLGY